MMHEIKTSNDVMRDALTSYEVCKKYSSFDEFYNTSPWHEQCMLVTGSCPGVLYKTVEEMKAGNLKLYEYEKKEYVDLIKKKILKIRCNLVLLKNLEAKGKIKILEENRFNVNVHEIKLLKVNK